MWLVVLAVQFVAAAPAGAFELLSWWRRELVEIDWEPGDWVTYAQLEITEDGAVADTVRVSVHAADDPDARWIQLTYPGLDRADRVLLRPDRLRRDGDPLAAIDSLVRREGDGPWIPEDLDAHRDERLVQRHLSDPFVDPTIERSALSDSTHVGETLTRERVLLTEEQRETRDVGTSTLVMTTRLRAEAIVSPQVPLAGILWARSLSVVTTATEGSGSSRSRRVNPPLVTERTIECLDFGHDSEAKSIRPHR